MNTAMLIGLVFVVLACVAFLFMDRINRSDMEDGRKKLITYGLFAGLVAIFCRAGGNLCAYIQAAQCRLDRRTQRWITTP